MTARYRKATAKEERLRKAAEQAALERALAVVDMHQSNMSYAQIADVTGLSRSRIQQLVEKARSCALCGEGGDLRVLIDAETLERTTLHDGCIGAFERQFG